MVSRSLVGPVDGLRLDPFATEAGASHLVVRVPPSALAALPDAFALVALALADRAAVWSSLLLPLNSPLLVETLLTKQLMQLVQVGLAQYWLTFVD